MGMGLSNMQIDRIYTALFTHSIGFFQVISTILDNNKSKYTALSSIWKVFAILLEFCFKHDYEMVVNKIS